MRAVARHGLPDGEVAKFPGGFFKPTSNAPVGLLIGAEILGLN